MDDITLYCFAQSGNSYKAALMLNLCALPWTPRFVDYFNGETRSEAYRAVNPMGEAPVLEYTADGRRERVSQSGVILDLLAGATGRFGWADEAGRREVLRWLLFDNHKFTSYTATYRWLVAIARNGDPAVLEFLKARMLGAFAIAERQLGTRDWIAGAQPTIADLSMCGYLYFEDEIGIDLGREFPNLKRWLGRIAALPGWKHPYDLMPGQAPARP
ncbi:MAG: glutathione S-transferase N-terminal domain-containing protein [Burkholderiales bacterium]|nr:glutathione S-transferase N-terminal domain-containing protein [Burkholderiales bacterium]